MEFRFLNTIYHDSIFILTKQIDMRKGFFYSITFNRFLYLIFLMNVFTTFYGLARLQYSNYLNDINISSCNFISINVGLQGSAIIGAKKFYVMIYILQIASFQII